MNVAVLQRVNLKRGISVTSTINASRRGWSEPKRALLSYPRGFAGGSRPALPTLAANYGLMKARGASHLPESDYK
jgi:hypothetical protein